MNIKDKKGSISMVVLVALLFMTSFLLILYASNVNRSKTVDEQFNIVKGIYSYTGGDEAAYDKAYTDLRNKNKETIKETLDDDSSIELTNTFEGNLSNYRIYGATNNIDQYQRVEYIESTGTQYIDTEYICLEDYKPYKIEVEFEYTDISSTTFIFGTAETIGNNNVLLFGIDADKNAWMFGHYGYEGSSIRFGEPDTNKHKIKYVFGKGVYLDDILQAETIEQASTSSNSSKNIGLFARIRNTTPTSYVYAKMYSCKFYEENDIIVRDFIPAQRKEDGEIGLYDIVNKVFYTNSGTGNFVSGAEVENGIVEGIGDLIEDTSDINYGKYKISIKVTNSDDVSQIKNIILNTPLYEGEYIDYKSKSVYKNDGTIETIELPDIPTYEDYTKIEIINEKVPLKTEVEYLKYSINE